jgi:hypothetical protein
VRKQYLHLVLLGPKKIKDLDALVVWLNDHLVQPLGKRFSDPHIMMMFSDFGSRVHDGLFPDLYFRVLLKAMDWRWDTFPWYYRRRQLLEHQHNMMDKFGFVPKVGDYVTDCTDTTQRIISVDDEDPDEVVLENGGSFSLWACCSIPSSPLPR